MTLNKFIDKNHIKLDKEVKIFCKEGISILKRSIDPMHESSHIYRLLDLLDEFLVNNKKIRKEINIDVLLLSICWHDAWKAGKYPNNIVEFMYQQLVEGFGSRSIFLKKSKKYDIDPKLIKKAAYSIRKHSFFQLFPKMSLESKVFGDIDEIDAYNFDRTMTCPDHPLFRRTIYIKMYSFYLSLDMGGSFPYAKKILKSVKKEYRNKLLNYYHP